MIGLNLNISLTPSPEQLLIEIENVLRDTPPRENFYRDKIDNSDWLGRAASVIYNWNMAKAIMFDHHIRCLDTRVANNKEKAINGIFTMLKEASYDLRLKTGGPKIVNIDQGYVFDYYDEVRKLIETAKRDLLFVDSYLDAEFASRYLPNVSKGVVIRLLTYNYLNKLSPAIHLLRKQNNLTIEIRSAQNLHERYIFVDKTSCYLSGPSFKDGPKNSPAIFMQILDTFESSLNTYEQIWDSSPVYE